MKNTDISDYALLEKSYISQDLSKNISGFNLNHYALSSCRYFEDSKILSVTFNASRFSKVGCKVQIGELTEWFKDIIGDIDSSITGSSNNLVNSFAEYVNYQKGKYIPNAVLFLGYKLLDELEQNEDIVIEKKEKSKYKELEYDELVAFLEKTNSFISIENGNIEYKELNDRCKITKAEIFNGLSIKDGPESKRQLLVKHFDKNNFFTLSYKDVEYRYFNGSLYKDSKLLIRRKWF